MLDKWTLHGDQILKVVWLPKCSFEGQEILLVHLSNQEATPRATISLLVRVDLNSNAKSMKIWCTSSFCWKVHVSILQNIDSKLSLFTSLAKLSLKAMISFLNDCRKSLCRGYIKRSKFNIAVYDDQLTIMLAFDLYSVFGVECFVNRCYVQARNLFSSRRFNGKPKLNVSLYDIHV